MAETGIEDLIREPKGCIGPLVFSLIAALVLLVVLGLIASYCAPDGANNSNQNITNQK
jgi:hypothetical protein